MNHGLSIYAVPFSVCVLVLGGAAGVCGEVNDPGHSNPMSIFEYFADAEWICESQWSSGRPFRGRMVYEWGLDGTILRAFSYDTGPEGEYLRHESILTWHPYRGEFRAYGFGSDGSVGEAVVTHPHEEEFFITSEPEDDSPESVFRQHIEIIDRDSFQWTVDMEIDDGWQELIRGTYHRQVDPG